MRSLHHRDGWTRATITSFIACLDRDAVLGLLIEALAVLVLVGLVMLVHSWWRHRQHEGELASVTAV